MSDATGNADGARLAARAIASLTDRVYGLCGGHVQPIWDELADADAEIIDVRDERAAVHAAHADADASDALGVALVTAGPGLTNALTGVANAETTGVPVLVVTGVPPVPQRDRGALQELPQRGMTEPVVESATTVLEAERVPGEIVAAAHAALDGRRPAYVEVPTDVLRDRPPTDVEVPTLDRPAPPAPAAAAVDEAAAARAAAERPVVIAGRGARSDAAAAAVRRFVDAAGVPFLSTAGSKGVLPADHALCLPAARGQAMATADALVLLGKRRDFTMAYGSEAVFGDATIVQVDVDPDALRRNGGPDVAVHGPVEATVDRLCDRLADGSLDGPLADEEWVADLQATNRERVERLAERKQSDGAPLHPYRVCGAIERALGDDAVVVCDGGDALSFGRVALPSSGPRGYLDPGPLGCLGVGLPFAIGASLARPEADVVCFTGDGALGFNLAELETAARHDVDLAVVVANNAAWNIERYDQLENYGRELGASLSDVRFDEVAAGMGVEATRVDSPDDLDEAVAAAIEASGPSLVDVVVDPEAVSPDARNGLAVVPRYQALETWDRLEREHRGEE